MLVLYSQNAPENKGIKLGKSNLLLTAYGCTTACLCDAASYFGEIKTPKEVAKSILYNNEGKVLWKNVGSVFDSMEFVWRGYTFDAQRINEALKDPSTCVLLNVENTKHWVLGLGGSIPLFGYKVADPWPYPSKITRRKDIVGYAIIRRK